MTDWYDHRQTVRSYKTTTYDRPLPYWHEQAACAEVAKDPAWAGAWTSEWHPFKTEAAEICKTACPVREICLKTAIADPQAEGTLGGFEFVNGRILREDVMEASKVTGKKIPLRPHIVRNRSHHGSQSSSL